MIDIIIIIHIQLKKHLNSAFHCIETLFIFTCVMICNLYQVSISILFST